MTDQSASRGDGWSAPDDSGWDDDGWGPATAVRAGSATRRSSARRALGAPKGAKDPRDATPYQPVRDDAYAPSGFDRAWAPAGPVRQPAAATATPTAPERGLKWWLALVVLIVIAAVGGLIDSLAGSQAREGFNIGIVVASVAAILLVRRSHMFPIVIAPPIVYSVAAVLQLYVRSGGLHDKKVVFDAAANYLVYGFPAIAAATAAVLIIAGIRMIVRR